MTPPRGAGRMTRLVPVTAFAVGAGFVGARVVAENPSVRRWAEAGVVLAVSAAVLAGFSLLAHLSVGSRPDGLPARFPAALLWAAAVYLVPALVVILVEHPVARAAAVALEGAAVAVSLLCLVAASVDRVERQQVLRQPFLHLHPVVGAATSLGVTCAVEGMGVWAMLPYLIGVAVWCAGVWRGERL